MENFFVASYKEIFEKFLLTSIKNSSRKLHLETSSGIITTDINKNYFIWFSPSCLKNNIFWKTVFLYMHLRTDIKHKIS